MYIFRPLISYFFITMHAQSHYNILWYSDQIYILQWVRCLGVNVNHLRFSENYGGGPSKKERCSHGQINRHHALKFKWMVKDESGIWWAVGQPWKAIEHLKAVRIWISGRTDSRLTPSQWETSLESSAVPHWLGANLESALSGWCLVQWWYRRTAWVDRFMFQVDLTQHGNTLEYIMYKHSMHDENKWKHFPRYWPFVREIHRWIPHTKVNDAELWYFLWTPSE